MKSIKEKMIEWFRGEPARVFSSRAAVIGDIASGVSFETGTVIITDKAAFVYDGSSGSIGDMQGFTWFGEPTIHHWCDPVTAVGVAEMGRAVGFIRQTSSAIVAGDQHVFTIYDWVFEGNSTLTVPDGSFVQINGVCRYNQASLPVVGEGKVLALSPKPSNQSAPPNLSGFAEFPYLARWTFENAATNAVDGVLPSVTQSPVVPAAMVQESGNTRGVMTSAFGAQALVGSAKYPPHCYHIGLGDGSAAVVTTDNNVETGFHLDFPISVPSGFIAHASRFKFRLGYDTDIASAHYYAFHCQAYVSKDGGENWIAKGSEINFKDLSALYNTGHTNGGYYISPREHSILISQFAALKEFTEDGGQFIMRLVFWVDTASTSGRRRIVVSDAGLTGMVASLSGSATNGTVYAGSGQFCGWVANGLWAQWGDKLSLSFDQGTWEDRDDYHDIDTTQPVYLRVCSSNDGGSNWYVDDKPNIVTTSTITSWLPAKAVDFSQAGFGMIFRNAACWLTEDFGETYYGPFRLPITPDGVWGREMRTMYFVDSPTQLTAFATIRKTVPDGNDDGLNRTYIIRTIDGGLSWRVLPVRVPFHAGNYRADQTRYSIMPSAVRIDRGHYVFAVRETLGGDAPVGIYETKNDFGTVEKVGQVGVSVENPPAMVLLKDGAIVLVQGYRALGRFGVAAIMSRDNGRNWTIPKYIRDDGRDWDIGYPKAWVLPDGKVLTAYYYHTEDLPEQRIAWSKFDPSELYSLPLQSDPSTQKSLSSMRDWNP